MSRGAGTGSRTRASVVRTTPVWQRALSLVKARPKVWGAGALAGLAVLLVIVVVSRRPEAGHADRPRRFRKREPSRSRRHRRARRSW